MPAPTTRPRTMMPSSTSPAFSTRLTTLITSPVRQLLHELRAVAPKPPPPPPTSARRALVERWLAQQEAVQVERLLTSRETFVRGGSPLARDAAVDTCGLADWVDETEVERFLRGPPAPSVCSTEDGAYYDMAIDTPAFSYTCLEDAEMVVEASLAPCPVSPPRKSQHAKRTSTSSASEAGMLSSSTHRAKLSSSSPITDYSDGHTLICGPSSTAIDGAPHSDTDSERTYCRPSTVGLLERAAGHRRKRSYAEDDDPAASIEFYTPYRPPHARPSTPPPRPSKRRRARARSDSDSSDSAVFDSLRSSAKRARREMREDAPQRYSFVCRPPTYSPIVRRRK